MRFSALIVCAFCVFAEDSPKVMTELTVKLESSDIPKDSFASQPKRIYRAGTRYCRIEENPDVEHGIHGLVIVNEPDSWLINRLDKTARHMVDPGPTFNSRAPMFVQGEEIKTDKDLKKPLMELEFGRELDFFQPKSPRPSPGPVLMGKSTIVYTVQVGDSRLALFTAEDSKTPVAVVLKNDKTRSIFWYGEYKQLPFDAKLFEKPEGVKIEELH